MENNLQTITLHFDISNPNIDTSVGRFPTKYVTFYSDDEFTIETQNHAKNWSGTLFYATDLNHWKSWDGKKIKSNKGKLYFTGKNNSTITGYVKDSGCDWVITSTSNVLFTNNLKLLLDWEEN